MTGAASLGASPTALTLMGREADVGTCVNLPNPHGLSWADCSDPQAAGRKKKASLLCRLQYDFRVSPVNIFITFCQLTLPVQLIPWDVTVPSFPLSSACTGVKPGLVFFKCEPCSAKSWLQMEHKEMLFIRIIAQPSWWLCDAPVCILLPHRASPFSWLKRCSWDC